MAQGAKAAWTVRGCKIGVHRGGSGPTILYLHGAGGAARWLPFFDKLSDRYDVILPEHPGFGASDLPPWLDNVGDLAFFYFDLIEQLGLKAVHLVGLSLGGWLAVEMAVRGHPSLRSLTAIAAAGINIPDVPRGDPFMWSPEETVRNAFHDPALAEAMLAIPPGPDDVDVQIKNRFALARLAWQPRFFNPHLEKWLHRIKVPAQIVWGAQDRVIPVAYAHTYAKAIPGAKLTIFEKCGHLPHIEKTDETVGLIHAFCQGAAR